MSDRRLRLLITAEELGRAIVRPPYDDIDKAALLLLIYHCRGEEPTDDTPILAGYPPLPYTCPVCGCVVTNPDDLRYSFAEVLP